MLFARLAFVVLRTSSLLLFLVPAISAQTVPIPKDVLGFTPGDDRKLASWTQIVDYFRQLDAASDRVVFQEIGKTTMGKPFVYATISSPANLRSLKRYEQINARLADPRTFRSNDAEARKLISQGKTIVLITCGIHSTEVGSTLSSTLIAHRLASSNEPEIKKILDNTIILLVPSLNPDGVDIVKNWYDKTLGTPYEGTEPPELYHKYIGHDNNRDWYAFTQVETQLAVDKIHNVWHPQIVHDIHQQGQNGSRLFLPPYMQPVEPNVPKQIVEGFTELGNYMADDMRKKGFQGITTNSSYDAWTPARAYSHYHGGVRILSETASARLASPVNIKLENLRVPADDGYDPRKESSNFSPIWLGGDWRLRNITEYMTTAAFTLLNHAADNREKWLMRFYEIGKEAVRPRRDNELFAFVIPASLNSPAAVEILRRGAVQVDRTTQPFTAGGVRYGAGSLVIPMAQPYASFAKALLEKQNYPDLLDPQGDPIPPYDVTAHTLPLLMGFEARPVTGKFNYATPPRGLVYDNGVATGCGCGVGRDGPRILGLFRSHQPSMDEGWTRWIIENYKNSTDLCCWRFESIGPSYFQRPLDPRFGAIIFPDQNANQILNGYAKGTMPEEYVGGLGKDGVENLKKFVEAGGKLIFLNRSSGFAIEQFDLPVRDVTRGLARKDFYIPGSILRTELDTSHPIAKGVPQQSIAWFENSPVFELNPGAKDFRVIAKYPEDKAGALLSGWALGLERLVGKAALVEFSRGKGKIILFGFRPQYRAQSLATFPLLFNAIAH